MLAGPRLPCLPHFMYLSFEILGILIIEGPHVLGYLLSNERNPPHYEA